MVDLEEGPPPPPAQNDDFESTHNADTFKRINRKASSVSAVSLNELFAPPPTPNTPHDHRKQAPAATMSPRMDRHEQFASQQRNNSQIHHSLPLEIETREHLRNLSAIPIDALNPHESEAEANILLALEQQGAELSKSSIFRHLSDDAVNDLVSASSTKDSKEEGSSKELGSKEGGSKEGGSKSEHTWNDGSHTSKASHPPPIHTGRHQRKLTLEGALTDVAMMLSAIHKKDEEKANVDSTHPAATAANDNNDHPALEKIEEEEQSPLLGSAETFAQNAMKLHSQDTSFRMMNAGLAAAHQLSSETDQSSTNENDDEELGPSTTATGEPNSKQPLRRKKKKTRKLHRKLNTDLEVWRSFFHLQREHIFRYLHTIILYIVAPAVGTSALLYYALGNPMSKTGASISWWILFVCVRQIVTLSLALATQAILIDFLALGTRVLMGLLGPVLTLCIVQSKGWPFVVFWWSVYDFALLYESKLGEHWLHWQSLIGMFSESNPSGDIVGAAGYRSALLIAISVSLVVMVKRFVVGLYLGRQTFLYYGEQLTNVLTKMLLVSEVASLAKDIEMEAEKGWNNDDNSLRGLAFTEGYYAESTRRFETTEADESLDTRVIDPDRRDALTGSLHDSDRMRLYQLLDQWEEPMVNRYRDSEKASISAVLNFRKALAFIQKTYPFSFAFGPARSREQCVESSQKVYERLLKRQSDQPVVHFETLALLTLDSNGVINQSKAKDIMRAFRPDRRGVLTMLDFVRSVDTIYREYRFLSAGIENSAVLDHQIENVLNWIFYAVIGVIIMSQLGLDPLAFFLSLSSVIVAFAFMIGNSASKFVDGISFIVGRRPYSIGDLIYFAHPESPMSFDGQPPYMVRNISLFETTAVWLPTNEHCSFSNGSLATSRVVNLAQSPNPQFFIKLKLPIKTPYDKILILKAAVEEFMKARPREWLSLNGFRAERIDASRGWIEYVVVAMGRSAWQELGQVLDSKANLSSYCQEVCKQLDIDYTAPPLPVNLKYNRTEESETEQHDPRQPLGTLDNETRAREFRQIAQTHNIRLN